MSTPTFETGARPSLPYFDSNGDNSVQTLKGTSGELTMLSVSNPNATEAFIQLFDEAGAITVGTTAPKLSLRVAGTGSLTIPFSRPVQFVNSIKYACTNSATGSTNPAVGLVVNAAYQ